MAYIKVISEVPLYNGMSVKFKSPCDSMDADGLIVVYGSDTRTFSFRDCNLNNLKGLGNLFAIGATVTCVIDTDNLYAFPQNADTNQYIETKFAGITPDGIGAAPKNHTHFAHEIPMLEREESVQDAIASIETEIGNMPPVYSLYEPSKNDIATVLTDLYFQLMGNSGTTYVWKKSRTYNVLLSTYHSIAGMELGYIRKNQETNVILDRKTYPARTFTYEASDTATFDEASGTITLDNPYTLTITVTPSNYGQSATVTCDHPSAKYIKYGSSIIDCPYLSNVSEYYRISEKTITESTSNVEGTITRTEYTGYLSARKKYYTETTDEELVTTTVADAYTEGQIIDGWTYTFLETRTTGTVLPKLEIGSYVGNGVAPTITFSGTPVLVVIVPPTSFAYTDRNDRNVEIQQDTDRYYLLINSQGYGVSKFDLTVISKTGDTPVACTDTFSFSGNVLTIAGTSFSRSGSGYEEYLKERMAILSFGGDKINEAIPKVTPVAATYKYFALIGGAL